MGAARVAPLSTHSRVEGELHSSLRGDCVDASKRAFLQALGAMVVGKYASAHLLGSPAAPKTRPSQRLIIVITGGMRRQETFSDRGQSNIPHLSGHLLANGLFYSHVWNDGVTSHFNSISSILTGNWQRVDDWGNSPPASPTLFEYVRRQAGLPASEVWMVASNKALTSQIGASNMGTYGAPYGANVVFPKVLLLTAVEEAIQTGHQSRLAERDKVQGEIESVMQSSDYEGLGWSVSGGAQGLDRKLEASVQSAIQQFVHTNAATTGDQLTYFVAVEIMRRYAPSLLVVNFSDVEVAHFGSYSMHLAGIRNADRLIYELWQEVGANPEYRDQTLMVVVPEFGRDPDGSNTNGFFNHRSNDESCRRIWTMCLGKPIARPQAIDRPVRQVDLCPSLAQWLGCKATESTGGALPEIAA
ncbi:MAG: hypothetical protein ACLQVL_29700 [Terriglobia bacterium]